MKNKSVLGHNFIYLILAFWFGSEVIFNSKIEKIFGWETSLLNDTFAYVVLVMLLIQIVFFQKYELKELAIVVITTGLIAIATLQSHHNIMMSTWLFIVATRDIDFEKAVKITYYVQLLMVLWIFYLFYFGFIEEYTFYRGSILRHSYGFTHPNQLGIRIFLLVVCRCYLRRKKFNILDFLIVIWASYFIYNTANSKTACYSLIIFAVLIAIYYFLAMLGVKLSFLSDIYIGIAIIANIISVFLSITNVKKIHMLAKFDDFLSHRFSLCHKVINYYGIKLLGQEVKMIVKKPGTGRVLHFWLDNAYDSILIRYGMLVFILFSVVFIKTLFVLKNSGHHFLVMILCMYSIYGIMENNFFFLSQNLFLILLSNALYNKKVNYEYESVEKYRLKLVWR